MTETTQYDNPNDIDSMDKLKIQTVSGSISPKIYANGRNQLPIEITAKAIDKDDRVLKFSHETWIHLLNLCFAESGEKLSRKGNSSWCFTEVKNDYSKEIQISYPTNSLFNVTDDGTVIIIMYVYTNNIDIKRIAVSVDTDNDKHFTTADNATGAEKMSIPVAAVNEIIYHKDSLIIIPVHEIGKKKNNATIFTVSGVTTSTRVKPFDCHYDNYYITVPFGIMHANTYAYGSVEGEIKWICAYDSEHDNQHFIIAHPFNKKGTETFGFTNTASWQHYGFGEPTLYDGKFDLTQNVTFNEMQNHICFTQMAFNTGDGWEVPDGQGLDRRPFIFDTWFELYDIYGNYGKFSVGFTDDHKSVKITDR